MQSVIHQYIGSATLRWTIDDLNVAELLDKNIDISA